MRSDNGSARAGRQRPLPLWFGVAAAVALGVLVAVQGRVSAALAARTDVENAAWVTVATGTAILLGIFSGSAATRRGMVRVVAALRARTLPWWALLGGVCGMFFVVTQGAAAGVLGLAMFGMCVVAGQVVGGLVFDWIGLAGTGRRRPTLLRVLGALLAISAVSFGAVAGTGSHLSVPLLLMAFAAGVGLAVNSGVTGRVNAASESPTASGLVNHLAGLLVITLLLLVTAPGDLSRFRLPPDPWLYLGGVIGPIGVGATAVLVGGLGVLLLGLGMVAGQLIGGLVLELIVPTGSGALQVSSVVGVVVTLAAVALTTLDGRRGAQQQQPRGREAAEADAGAS